MQNMDFKTEIEVLIMLKEAASRQENNISIGKAAYLLFLCSYSFSYIRYCELIDSLLTTRRMVSAKMSAIESCFTFLLLP